MKNNQSKRIQGTLLLKEKERDKKKLVKSNGALLLNYFYNAGKKKKTHINVRGLKRVETLVTFNLPQTF